MLLTYTLIEKNAKERTENFSLFKNSNLRQEITDTNYGLYYNYLENKAKKDKSDIEPYKDLIINLINRVNSLGNLKVYAVDGEGNTVYKSEGDQSFLVKNLDAISSIVSFNYLVVIFGFIFKYLLIILGANFVIVSSFCIFGVFGIFFSLIYSVVLFYFGRKYIDKIKKDYKNILEKTEEISKGNFEFKEDLDFGLFNELKGDLNNIQKGFEEAVLKEVKSQRMKTELISNVSHDLKTPLTSIIAYVDLLKGEEDEDKRKSYLETLDRKSQRLKYLIEDLFEVSKATTGDVKLNIMKIDIS